MPNKTALISAKLFKLWSSYIWSATRAIGGSLPPSLTDLDQAIFQIGNDLLQKAVADNRLAIRLIGVGISNLNEPGLQLSMMNGTEQ
jgi:impB/mucB/samB family C-terminal domain